MTRTELLLLSALNLPDNAANLITAQKLREVVAALVNSKLNLDTDKLYLGFARWTSARPYRRYEIVWEANKLWISNENSNLNRHPVSGPAGWWNELVLANNTSNPPPGTSVWDNAATYAQGVYVEHAGQLWRSLQASNTAREPGQPSGNGWWVGVSLPGSFGDPYSPGTYYTAGNVVRHNNRLWEAQSSLLASNFTAELGANQWVEVSPAVEGYAFQGIPNVVPTDQTFICAAGHQWPVHGTLYIDGTFVANGEVVYY